ncbi:hypothetical protein E2C01_067592 [Portunus trituberculatus]|uniref:Uncharacterized protein n=1 Tax=Portunus trituberculatus TaxID=210409 RepID=A0A5B7HU20_PORTR|nr:hypothetical protein [Portunus trituberculatus]
MQVPGGGSQVLHKILAIISPCSSPQLPSLHFTRKVLPTQTPSARDETKMSWVSGASRCHPVFVAVLLPSSWCDSFPITSTYAALFTRLEGDGNTESHCSKVNRSLPQYILLIVVF